MTRHSILKRKHVIKTLKVAYYQKLFPHCLLILRICCNMAADHGNCKHPGLEQVTLRSTDAPLSVLSFCYDSGSQLKKKKGFV